MFLGSRLSGYIFSQVTRARTKRPTSVKALAMLGALIESMVEAAGVEPASEKVYRRRLRAFPIRWFSTAPCGTGKSEAA